MRNWMLRANLIANGPMIANAFKPSPELGVKRFLVSGSKVMAQKQARGYRGLDPAEERELARRKRQADFERRSTHEFAEESDSEWGNDRGRRRGVTYRENDYRRF